jgi:hypothetical protein
MKLIGALLNIVASLSKWVALLFAYSKGKTDVENKNLKDTTERLANRPRTNNDVVVQLREWSKHLKRRGK